MDQRNQPEVVRMHDESGVALVSPFAEQRRENEALKAENERLRLLLGAAPIPPQFGNHDDWFDIYIDWRKLAKRALYSDESEA